MESTRTCRSIFQLKYFGESGEQRCGQCDVCLERNKAHLSKLEFNTILTQIKPLLKAHPQKPEDIVNSVKNTSPDKCRRVVEWLLDNDKILYTSDKKLSWQNEP